MINLCNVFFWDTRYYILSYFFSFKLEEDSGDDDDDLLQIRQRSKEEKEDEEKDYKQWLKKEGRNLVRNSLCQRNEQYHPKVMNNFFSKN